MGGWECVGVVARVWGGFADEHEYTVLLLICNGGVYNTYCVMAGLHTCTSWNPTPLSLTQTVVN